MKCNSIPKAALVCLVTGLLLTSITPIISNHYAIPDFLRGFSTGLGLTLELIALVKIQRSRKSSNAG